jgi:hypothetical protein
LCTPVLRGDHKHGPVCVVNFRALAVGGSWRSPRTGYLSPRPAFEAAAEGRRTRRASITSKQHSAPAVAQAPAISLSATRRAQPVAPAGSKAGPKITALEAQDAGARAWLHAQAGADAQAHGGRRQPPPAAVRRGPTRRVRAPRGCRRVADGAPAAAAAAALTRAAGHMYRRGMVLRPRLCTRAGAQRCARRRTYAVLPSSRTLDALARQGPAEPRRAAGAPRHHRWRGTRSVRPARGAAPLCVSRRRRGRARGGDDDGGGRRARKAAGPPAPRAHTRGRPSVAPPSARGIPPPPQRR